MRVWQVLALAVMVAPLAACATDHSVKRAAFTSREFGVAVSPRVTTAKYPPHGGGRYLPDTPYVVRGVTYKPVDGPGYVKRGEASWYGMDFHGRRTANGEIFGAYYLTAASPVLPIPCYARITNLENGRSVLVRVNDRGPYMQGRIADVSYETASVLGFVNKGSAKVQVAYVGPAPLEGDDTRMLMASIDTPTNIEQEGETRVAMASPPSKRASSAHGPANRDLFSGGLIGDIKNLFGYAEEPRTNADIDSAIAAATAMATRASALEGWKNAVDIDARRIHLELGVFPDGRQALQVAEALAMLGAVDEIPVASGGRAATRLTLTHLKPGVARTDVLALARKLGLADIVLY